MKNSICIFTTVLFSAITMACFGGTWENYSNITQLTDAKPVGDHIWTTCKGGVIDFNTATGEKVVYKKGDAGLPSDAIEQIAVSSLDATIWVGTYDAGVVEWNGTNWLTYEFPVVFSLYRMKFDSFGDLWLQTNLGLYKFDCVTHEYTFINSVGGAGWDFNAWDFDITADDQVLIFTGTSCVVIDAATNTPIDSFPNTDSPVVLGCSPSTVRVYEVDENTYLINNNGFLEFEYKDGTYISADEGLPDFVFFGNITRGSDNNLYILVGNEIYKLVGTTWTFINSIDGYTTEKLFYTDGIEFYVSEYACLNIPVLININAAETNVFITRDVEFNSNNITGLAKNAEGEILIASAGNIYSYTTINNNWDLFLSVPTEYGSMSDMKFVNGNVYIIDYGNLIEYYDGINWTHVPLCDGYSSIYIYDYCVTSTSVVYFVNDEGLFKYEAGETTMVLESTGGVSGWFLSLDYDETNNLVWLGKTSGIVKYDFITQDFINSADVPAMADGSSIQIIEIDNDNNVWFGANNNKVYKYDGVEWVDYTIGSDGDFIIEIEFSGTKIYFGLTDGTEGVHIYDSVDNSWEYFNTSTDANMPSNSVTQLAIDNDNNFWMAHSDLGISVYREEAEPVTIISDEILDVMNVYPNPASNTITVNMLLNADNFIRINDWNGQLLISKKADNSTIDISSLPAGIYLLTIYETNSGQMFTSKFTVVK